MHNKFSYISLYEYWQKLETLKQVLTAFYHSKVLKNEHVIVKNIVSDIQGHLEVPLKIIMVRIEWINIFIILRWTFFHL